MPREVKLIFLKTIQDYLKNTSITGLKYLSRYQVTWFERFYWLTLQIILLISTLFFIQYTFEDFFKEPLVSSLETSSYPIKKINFAGISICNINKISKKRATEYSRLISQRGNLPFEYVFKNVKALGKLYDYEIDDLSEYDYLNFQTILERYGIVDNNLTENTYLYHIMRNLSTPCDELLQLCTWKGENRSCSDMFTLRRTYEGFCCTFNYVRTKELYFDYKKTAAPETLNRTGWEHGLMVVVYNEPEDYLYPLISSIGVNVHIFNPYDYPDVISGGLLQELIGVGTQTFIKLGADTFYSVPEIRKYSIKTRKCIFNDEASTILGQYSKSNCLLQCRIESVLALCNCVPLLMPWFTNVSFCILSDILCLSKYQEKWRNLYPEDDKSTELDHEKQNSLTCKSCYTECMDTQYRVSSEWVPLNLHGPDEQKYKNYSIIRIYFGRDHTNLYKQDVIFYWYEILSNIGGLLGLFLGISFISIFELMYYFIFRFVKYFMQQSV